MKVRRSILPVKETRITFRSEGLSLEGILTIPGGVEPFPAVIVCHPHPLYGGSMDNNVVNALCEALTQKSLISLKFNFRGVGRSEGEFGQGIGAQEDIDAAISFIGTVREADSNRIGLVGYSAGAGFALPVGFNNSQIKALAAISPPLSMFDFGFLKDCLKPNLLISGSGDDFTSSSQFLEFCQNLPQPTEYHSIKGADHFWWGYESDLAAKIADFFNRVLK